MHDDDDATALLRAASDGDAKAAESFVRLTQGPVRRFCAHLVDASQADDLAQETYLRAFASLGAFKGRSTALTWLLGVARHACADHYRTASRRLTVDRLEPEHERRLAGRADHAEQTALTDLLAGLTPDRREAFVLTQLIGLSYDEAAEVCGCPLGTIRSRVARARDDLVVAHAAAIRDERTG